MAPDVSQTAPGLEDARRHRPGGSLKKLPGNAPALELLLAVDRSDPRPIQVQLYDGIRRLILSGGLKAAHRLPSSRALAAQYSISRNTVVLAYERLVDEGYVKTRPKAGIYVNESLPDAAVLVRTGHKETPTPARRVQHGKLPPFHGQAPEVWRDRSLRPSLDLFVGRPHAHSFPFRFWRRAAARHLVRSQGDHTEYGDPRGLLRLRQAIATHLVATRGIQAAPDQVLITSGIQGALNVIARILLTNRKASRVAIENPCYQGAAYLFESYGARLVPIDVEGQGLDVSQLERSPARLVYVTPSHQFPTGFTLALERRLNLLDWAYRTGSYIVEDDYDSDFRYDGPPLTALAGLDRRGHVLYVGTFSKSIGAGMRLGYLVLPRHLADRACVAKGLLDNGGPWLEQAVLADFLEEGEFLRHLRRIRNAYLLARNTLIQSLNEQFGEVAVFGAEGGMHIMWQLPENLPDAQQMQQLARSRDVGLYPLPAAAAYEFDGRQRYSERHLILGYTALSSCELCEAVERVAEGTRELAAKSSRRRSRPPAQR